MKTLKEQLTKLGACPEAVKWVGDTTLQQAWQTCERTDWMLWLCGKMVDKPGWPTRQDLVLAACDCARTALRYVPDGETRPLAAIETAERWTRGEATIAEVEAARAEAGAAREASAKAWASARAAERAAWAAGASAWAAGAAAHKQMADLIRLRLKPGKL